VPKYTSVKRLLPLEKHTWRHSLAGLVTLILL